MLNQNQIKNLYFDTVSDAESHGRPREKCYVEETGHHYAYVPNSGQTIDHIKTLSTTNGGDTRWIAVNDYLSAGVYTSPSVIDNHDGTITIGNGGVYHLHDSVDGGGFIRSYTVDGGTFDASNPIPHYIVVNYNGGTPVMQCIEDYSSINGTTIIPILIICYNVVTSPNAFDIIDWGEQAKAVASNTKLRFLFAGTNGVEDGVFQLSVFDTRKIKITGGNRWYGLSRINYDLFETGVGDCVLREWVKDGGGNWSPSIVSEYDNKSYQGASGKTPLVNNYGVIWVYRKLSTTDPLGTVAGYIFGNDDYNKLSDAQATTPPTYANIPPIFVSFGIFVGRIIIDKRNDDPVEVDSAFSYLFGASTPEHNDTLHKQGGSEVLDEFYHLTLDQYNNLGTGEHNTLSGLQGGSVFPEEFYHLTKDQYDNLGVYDHNGLINLQGGSASPEEYYHLTQSEYTFLSSIPEPVDNYDFLVGAGGSVDYNLIDDDCTSLSGWTYDNNVWSLAGGGFYFNNIGDSGALLPNPSITFAGLTATLEIRTEFISLDDHENSADFRMYWAFDSSYLLDIFWCQDGIWTFNPSFVMYKICDNDYNDTTWKIEFDSINGSVSFYKNGTLVSTFDTPVNAFVVPFFQFEACESTEGYVLPSIRVGDGIASGDLYWSRKSLAETEAILSHNNLHGLQGGSSSPEEYYHLTAEQYLNATSVASESSLGLVQIGTGLTITGEGVVSVPLGGGLGLAEGEIVVLIGNGIDINEEGRVLVDETELDHNLIGNLQGGSVSPEEYYHLTSAEHVVVQNTSGVNTGDQSSEDFTHNDLLGLEGGGGSPESYYHLDKIDYDALTDVNAQLEELHSDGSPTFDTVTATLADIGTIHAVYSDSTTQTITSTTVPWAMTFDTEEISDTHITHGKSGEVTISIASPAVISWTGHGLNVDSEVVFTTDGALPTGLTAGTRYYVISAGFGVDSFQVSATPQGAAINTSDTQSGTHTATNISIFTIGTAGTYGFIFSTLCDCTSGNGTTVDIWFRKNGVDVDRSNTRVQIATASNVVISIADIILDLIVGDEIEMFWVGSSTNDRILAVAAQVSPTRPATPSTILTIKKVSK